MSPFPNLKKLKHRTGLRKKSRKMTTMPKRPVGGFIKVGETIEERREKCADQGGGSLPERMARRSLIALGVPFEEQHSVGGNSLFAIVDFIVHIGVQPVAFRIMSYYHTELDRVQWDLVQRSRLVARGYVVKDVHEKALYAAADVSCKEVVGLVKRTLFSAEVPL